MITLYSIVHYYHFHDGNGTLRSTITIFNTLAIVLAVLSTGCGRVLNACYNAELGANSSEENYIVSDLIYICFSHLMMQRPRYHSKYTVHSPYHLVYWQ